MQSPRITWKRYHELRPDELAEFIESAPIVLWPLGLIEHHGWHLPVGYDGIKAERICIRIAERTSGVILPTMWWGANGGEAVKIRGDHAARQETSFGLYLLPELVDMEALRPGRDASAWPRSEAPPVEERHPGVCFDPNEPLFAQLGEDARTASAERGEEAIARLVNHLTAIIRSHLG